MQATFSKVQGLRLECMFKCRFRIYFQVQGLLHQLALDASRGELVRRNWRNAPNELSPKPDPYELRAPRGCSLLFPKAIANGGQSIRANFAVTKSNTGIKLQRRLIVKHGFHWCEIHSSDLCFFSVIRKILRLSRIQFIHEESRNVTNSKLDWAVVFTARYARRNRKTTHLGTRLRKPSKAVADPLDNHEGRYTKEQKQVNPLTVSWCGIVQTGKEGQEPALACTRKPRETQLAGILRYLYTVYICYQLMLGSKVARSKSTPFEPRVLHTLR